MRKFLRLLSIIVIVSLFVSCDKSEGANLFGTGAPTPTDEVTTTGAIKAVTNGATKEDIELTVWQTYWSNDEIVKEMELLKGSINNVIHFAAYFNAENELFIPKEIVGLNHTIEINHKEEFIHYLSFVNDKIRSDGTSSLKDTTLLYELFKDSNAIEQHVNSICELAAENGFDGIEIDYESMKDDLKLWRLYLEFIHKLYQKTQNLDLELRVILEPSAPLEEIKTKKLKFPKGPQYVMMCYNLHGYGSKPGAKADKKFIIGLITKIKLLDDRVDLAFATGGFDWEEEGDVKALTESEATTLQKYYGVKSVREKKSAALTFSYLDKESNKHTVWYADGTTIKEWMEIARKQGVIKFSLWRLNGNESDSLKAIAYFVQD